MPLDDNRVRAATLRVGDLIRDTERLYVQEQRCYEAVARFNGRMQDVLACSGKAGLAGASREDLQALIEAAGKNWEELINMAVARGITDT